MFRITRSLGVIAQMFPKRNLVQTLDCKLNRLFLLKRFNSSNNKPRNVYLIDEEDSSLSDSSNNINKFTNRTHTCGELNIENVGERVTLCGWLEYQRMKKFVVIRDSYGQTQLLISEKDLKSQELVENLPLESIIQVEGSVVSRPLNMRNPSQKTGDVEIVVEKITVLNKSKDNLPFNIREFQKAKESLRMQYRYLDLRFPQMQRNLRVRSEMLMKMRQFLVNHCGFVDVETPTLFKATPGGAQEFIVPTRFPGQFYSLVQSPQQFKQMLMAGAIDRYFQIARCYRDEGSRPDRQPEFTQLDIEMSFTGLDHIFQLIEQLLGYSWPNFLQPLPKKFKRMTFCEAMENYGSDQPDTRFEFHLRNCTDLLLAKKGDNKNFGAYFVHFPKEYATLSKQIKEKFNELGKKYTKAKLVQVKVTNSNDFIGKMTKLLTESIAQKLAGLIDIKDESVIFLTYGNKNEAQSLLGKVRVDYADFLEGLGITIREKGMHLLWVTDFPLFECGDNGELQSAHHPFTSPNLDDLELLENDPFKVRALSFDLVLNGNEIGGGSVRIHNPKLQEKILKMLNIDISTMQHIIDMLSSGCPPHGGIALGLDRLMSKILQTTSIRDVIAFPKTFEGRDPLSGAPSEITDADQKLYHIKSVK